MANLFAENRFQRPLMNGTHHLGKERALSNHVFKKFGRFFIRKSRIFKFSFLGPNILSEPGHQIFSKFPAHIVLRHVNVRIHESGNQDFPGIQYGYLNRFNHLATNCTRHLFKRADLLNESRITHEQSPIGVKITLRGALRIKERAPEDLHATLKLLEVIINRFFAPFKKKH